MFLNYDFCDDFGTKNLKFDMECFKYEIFEKSSIIMETICIGILNLTCRFLLGHDAPKEKFFF